MEREREVGASRPEVDDAQASVRKPRNDVVDELDEAVHLPELPAALRAHAAVRRLDAELHEERDGLPLGQEVALPSVVDALRPWPRRRPLQDARRVAAGEDLPVGVGLLEQRLPVARRRSPRKGRRRAPGRRGSRPSSGARSGDARASESPWRRVTGSTVIRLGSSGCAVRGRLSVAPVSVDSPTSRSTRSSTSLTPLGRRRRRAARWRRRPRRSRRGRGRRRPAARRSRSPSSSPRRRTAADPPRRRRRPRRRP